MATAHVYAPFSGDNWGQSNYCYCCSGGAHPVVDQCCNPIDIGRYSQTNMYFYCNSNVKSIKTTPVLGGVCTGSPGSPWDDLVRVEMYSDINAGGVLIGKVVYAHVASPFGSSTWNNPNGTYIGQVAPDTCSCGNCYAGYHVHMESDGGGSYASTFTCGQSVNTFTKIFSWTF